MSFSRITTYQLEEFLKSHPEFLKEIIRDLYKETAIEFKERLTSKEAAKYLNISVKTLANLCCDKKIPYYKVGKCREFLLEDLKQYRLNKEKYIPSIY
jgi:excisionase family DNA binding protein